MAFTPLVSPAVTPLDAHFAVDTGFTVPGAYFSPLTSPALHAQSDPMAGYDVRHASRSTASPVDLDKDSPAAPVSSVDLSKKVRKNNVSKARKSNVRQSPLVKPQRRKTLSTPNMKAQILSELAESTAERAAQEKQPQQQILAPPSSVSTEGSENASISPEALSEMPPPPIPQPRSARQSPYMQAQSNSQVGALPQGAASLRGKPSPATPASLFRISPGSKPSDATAPDQVASDHIESFALPEPISMARPDLTPIMTQQSSVVNNNNMEGPKASFQALPSPVILKQQPRSATSNESPMLTPKAPTPNLRKTPLMAARGSKKGRSGSVQVSPALLPRISPNIKPLLPGTPGMSAEDTASLLLASKSNYQNILEGNKVPGITYPSELSTNLTSKRTSHKIAEQGRRNRINSALQEIAALLPNSVKEGIEADENSSGADKKEGKATNSNANANANAPNSKASTVELAIIYIKQLQKEVAEANQRAEEAEKKLSEMMAA
ncbi:uncharacterized protein B0I36DRAFT_317584 [Microdochium trichocladiopsis]|uniref:BHLH domain-containing protein n=1 Tax=Microdochium trichocladiopsis TaxID=1682393 RepID=A0A9P9BSQ9_9PEZI|nr:uncharacterized protein B0I36DRAFT_317584 [Microdochium trichocladiopsis]KAH7035085.1 hypothetical protein B0I36DRAFT_317584 [Microdochium trichocladiopsis]